MVSLLQVSAAVTACFALLSIVSMLRQTNEEIQPSVRGLVVPSVLVHHSSVRAVEKGPTFGFYLPVYNQVPSVLLVLRNARKFYPDSPIHLLQDGGNINFTLICKMPRYGCTFDRAVGENSPWNPHSWLSRFRKATQILGTDYVIYLEPDVAINHRHTLQPTFDAGGIFDDSNPATQQVTMRYLERLGRKRNPCFKIKWTHFGLAGGSYFRSEAVLDAFAPKHIKHIDWRKLKEQVGALADASDWVMIVALHARGWSVYPWKDVAEARKKSFFQMLVGYVPEEAFTHNRKEHYNDPVPPEESALIQPFFIDWPDLSCHGCVWYPDADPAKPRLAIPSEAPEVFGEDRLMDDEPEQPTCL